MDLLILKTGNDYIRFKDGKYLLVGLDKASVYPMDQIDQVRTHMSELEKNGFKNVRIRKLILSEEDL